MRLPNKRWPIILMILRLPLINSQDNKNDTGHETITDNEGNIRTFNNEGKESFDDGTNGTENESYDVDAAVHFGLASMRDLVDVKEPLWYRMGLVLGEEEPASRLARFGAPLSQKATDFARYGYATLAASRKIAELSRSGIGRQSSFALNEHQQARILPNECPLRGRPRCVGPSRRYRTPDGTCNNADRPWLGAAMLPMQRFLHPVYEDGVESVRRSVFGAQLPSARKISTTIHRDRDHEIHSVTLMFMQWGQFLDHDITSNMKSRSFNGSIPRCCERGGLGLLPPEVTHPSCLPIEVPDDDWFLSRFNQRCIEFVRSAPTTRIDCELGWREQINQVTPYIDASTIYGSDLDTSDSVRTFRNGKLFYGRPRSGNLQPPDPPGGELCREGAVSSDCFQAGDGRVGEQTGLTGMHTIFVRYHNKIAGVLTKLNPHWSDEKTFQETRRIVYSVVQHITYREFLPIVLGHEVMELFELILKRKGYYTGYDARVNPAIANAFSTAAFRFGHSMVQNSFVRTDVKHRPIFNNVSLHEEFDNFENIFTFGSLDRLMLGLCNQPSQRRDTFMCEELTNHLFEAPGGRPFGMDLAAINIQRGRDHGIPPYTAWRVPCGLSEIRNWSDLAVVLSGDSVQRFKALYLDVDDIDLFSGGLAEKPVRGGVVGPTFACIIAQQFHQLRKGDRFWYENGDFKSSFTPAQLQQIRKVTLSQVLCKTLTEIETIQPFVFLSNDNFGNKRENCEGDEMNSFSLLPWAERDAENEIEPENRRNDEDKVSFNIRSAKKRRKVASSTARSTAKPRKSTESPIKFQIMNVSSNSVLFENKYGNNDLANRPSYTAILRPQNNFYDQDNTFVPSKMQKPLEVNIKIQYYLPTTTTPTTKRPKKKKRPTTVYYQQPVVITRRPTSTTGRPSDVSYPIFVTNGYNSARPTYTDSYYDRPDYYTTQRPYLIRPQTSYQYEQTPFATSDRPYIYRPNSYDYTSSRPGYFYEETTTRKPTFIYSNKRPIDQSYKQQQQHDIHAVYSGVLDNGPEVFINGPKKPTFGQVETVTKKQNKIYALSHVEKLGEHNVEDRLDFKTHLVFLHRNVGQNGDADERRKFVKISSVKAQADVNTRNPEFYVVQRKDGDDIELFDEGDRVEEKVEVVDIDVIPDETRAHQWLVYNETDDKMPPSIPLLADESVPCSKELPQPMTLNVKRNSTTERNND